MLKRRHVAFSGIAALIAVFALSVSAVAAAAPQIGPSGRTFASDAVSCATNPTTGLLAPVVEAGLYQPRAKTKATVSLNGETVATVTTANPVATVWLADGANEVVVTINKKTSDTYTFTVPAGMCSPDTSGNTFSADGLWEYGASGKSSVTVTAGCAWNAATGQPQPYVHLVDNGNYLLNISVNGVPLTQLSATNPHTTVFLNAGQNVISAANGSLSTDYYVRDGGSGTCTLP